MVPSKCGASSHQDLGLLQKQFGWPFWPYPLLPRAPPPIGLFFLSGVSRAELPGEERTRTEWVPQAPGQRALSCREGSAPLRLQTMGEKQPIGFMQTLFPLRLSSV